MRADGDIGPYDILSDTAHATAISLAMRRGEQCSSADAAAMLLWAHTVRPYTNFIQPARRSLGSPSRGAVGEAD